MGKADGTPFLSTKFAVDPALGQDIPSQIETSLRASLDRLGRDSVDLLQLHNHIEPSAGGRGITVDHVLGANGVADGLDRLREKGLIRLHGITALGDTACCREVIESGRIDSAQVYHNILNPSAAMDMPADWTGQNFAGMIASCRANGVAVMNIRVFAASVLATEARHGREGILTKDTELDEEIRKARAVAELLGDTYGTPAQTALRFALANQNISTIVVGMAELDHLEQALAAAEMGPLPDAALGQLAGLYATDFGRV